MEESDQNKTPVAASQFSTVLITLWLRMDREKYAKNRWSAFFKFMDFRGTGALCFSDAMEYPCQLLRVGKIDSAIAIAKIRRKVWDSLLEILGKSNDQKSISEEDFVKSICVLSEQDWYHDEAVPSVASAMFDGLDENKDDLISLVEWRHHYERQGVKDEDFVRSTFAKMDSNNDGMISRQEFEYAVKMYFKHDPQNDYSFLFTLE